MSIPIPPPLPPDTILGVPQPPPLPTEPILGIPVAPPLPPGTTLPPSITTPSTSSVPAQTAPQPQQTSQPTAAVAGVPPTDTSATLPPNSVLPNSSTPFQPFEVPLVHSSESIETLNQIQDVILYLRLSIGASFKAIKDRIAFEKSRLDAITARAQKADTKIKAMGQVSRALTVFSSAKYPGATDKPKISSPLINSPYTKIDRPTYKYPIGYTGPLATIRQGIDYTRCNLMFEGRMLPKMPSTDKTTFQNEGLGRLPYRLKSVCNLLLFNSSENPYKSFYSLDNLEGFNRKEKHRETENKGNELFAAPASVNDREGIDIYGEQSFVFRPSAPTSILDAPTVLPGLDKVAVDQMLTTELPSIAPSAFPNAQKNLPIVQPLEPPQTTTTTMLFTPPSVVGPQTAQPQTATPSGTPPAAPPLAPPVAPPVPSTSSSIPLPPPLPESSGGGIPLPPPLPESSEGGIPLPPPLPDSSTPASSAGSGTPATGAELENSPPPSEPGPARGNLLLEIQRGFKLKKVGDPMLKKKDKPKKKPAGGGGGGGGLMGELTKRLMMMRKATSGSADDSDGEDNNNDDDDDDDSPPKKPAKKPPPKKESSPSKSELPPIKSPEPKPEPKPQPKEDTPPEPKQKLPSLNLDSKDDEDDDNDLANRDQPEQTSSSTATALMQSMIKLKGLQAQLDESDSDDMPDWDD